MGKDFVDSAVALAAVPISVVLSLAFIYSAFWLGKRGITVVENNTKALISLQKAQETQSATMIKQGDVLASFGRELSVHAVRAERIEQDVSTLKDDMSYVKGSMVTKQEIQSFLVGGRRE